MTQISKDSNEMKKYQLIQPLKDEEFIPVNKTIVVWVDDFKAYYDEYGNIFSRAEVEDSGNWKQIL